MNEVITDELIDAIAEDYFAYKKLAERFVGNTILTFEEYFQNKLKLRKSDEIEWQEQEESVQ